jgi:UDP-N-acetyl-D-mannosaminuronic acid transferase (WecB/TagA/CpsF family)
MSARELSRLRYAGNPFVEAVEIARYIAEQTGASERIAVLGSEPDIYFYADRRSATGYMYTYALMESQPYARTMQEEMIQEIESAHPTYLVFVRIGLSWLPRPGSDQTILQWASRYTQACHGLVGIADIHAPDSTKYAWEDGGMGYRLASQELIYTFRRTSDAPCAIGHR